MFLEGRGRWVNLVGMRAGASSRCSLLSFLTCPPTDKESRPAAHDRTSFLRGFGMKREKRREAPPLFSRIRRTTMTVISAAGFPCWWAGERRREQTIGTSRPVCASLSSSVLSHLHFHLQAWRTAAFSSNIFLQFSNSVP